MGISIDRRSIKRTLDFIGRSRAAVEKAVEDAFAEAGTYVVYSIRSGRMSNWNNDTGNLRSSIGFAVTRKGQIVRQSKFGTILGGSEGAEKGRQACEKLAREYARYNYALIIVAGEEYAVYVEAVEGKSVLAGGQLYIEKNIKNVLQRKINKALNEK